MINTHRVYTKRSSTMIKTHLGPLIIHDSALISFRQCTTTTNTITITTTTNKNTTTTTATTTTTNNKNNTTINNNSFSIIEKRASKKRSEGLSKLSFWIHLTCGHADTSPSNYITARRLLRSSLKPRCLEEQHRGVINPNYK